MQGLADEKAEREEAEAARLRELAAAEEAEAMAEAEMMRAEQEGQGEDGEAEADGRPGERDLDDDVPDADDGGAWASDDEDEEVEDIDDGEESIDSDEIDDDRPAALPPRRRQNVPTTPVTGDIITPVRPMAPPGVFTPTPDRDRERDRTPRHFRVNPFQSTHFGEGDGDYGPAPSSPLAAVPGPRQRLRGGRGRDLSPGFAAGNRAGERLPRQNYQQMLSALARGGDGEASTPVLADTSRLIEMDTTMNMEVDMDMDAPSASVSPSAADEAEEGDDAVAEGSYEHTDTELEEASSLDGNLNGSIGLGLHLDRANEDIGDGGFGTGSVFDLGASGTGAVTGEFESGEGLGPARRTTSGGGNARTTTTPASRASGVTARANRSVNVEGSATRGGRGMGMSSGNVNGAGNASGRSRGRARGRGRGRGS